jgi:DNA-binding CsgD family transcriptional regulator/tetratricopeptide (TPR) repeat protein/KaiC/GvpD/RAD55 family RecA-like ATPase
MASELELIGREPELSEIRRKLRAASTGRGQVVAVVGEAGIGKSRLAAEAAESATVQGFATGVGAYSEGIASPSLWGWLQALRALGIDARRPDQSMFETFIEVSNRLRMQALKAPLLVALEDIHWADTESLQLLEFLTAELADSPILVIVTARPPSPQTTVQRAISSIGRAHGGSIVELLPLSANEARALVRVHVPPSVDDARVEHICQRSGGIPLFAVELAKASSNSEVPASLLSIIGDRLSSAPTPTRRLIQAAAAAGDSASLTVVADASGVSREEAVASVGVAVHAGLLEPVADAVLRFRHSIVREAVLAQTEPQELLALHRELASAFERRGAGSVEDLSAAAHHSVLAMPIFEPERALALCVAAGSAALTRNEFELGSEHFEDALKALALCDVGAEPKALTLMKAGQARSVAGNIRGGKELLAEAVELSRVCQNPSLFASAALAYAQLEEVGLAQPQRVRWLQEALRNPLPDDLRLRLQAKLAESLKHSGQAGGDALSAATLQQSRAVGDKQTVALALEGRLWALRDAPLLAERLELSRELLDLGEQLHEDRHVVSALRWLVTTAFESADGFELRNAVRTHARRAEVVRDPLLLWRSANHDVALHLLDGDFGEAETALERSRELGNRLQSRGRAAFHAVQLYGIRRMQGRLEEIEDGFRSSVTKANTAPGIYALLAAAAVSAGRLDQAHRDVSTLLKRVAPGRVVESMGRGPAYLLGEAAAATGDSALLERMWRELEPFRDEVATFAGHLTPLGPVARVLGHLAAAQRRREDAERCFQRALEICVRLGSEPMRAEVTADYGEFLLERAASSAAKGEALDLVESANAEALRLGMRHVSARCRALLPGSTSRAPAGLTAREVEILRLLAGGGSIRGVADGLVLSDRTVERHITNIYNKIGARNRSEATAFAARHGLI